MTTTRKIISATAYYDESDPRNLWWAYRIRFSDGHEESGALGDSGADAADAACLLADEVARHVDAGEEA